MRTPPIIEPLPDPIPGHPPTPLFIQPDDDWDNSSIWDNTPPQADTKPRPPPASDPDEETPPF